MDDLQITQRRRERLEFVVAIYFAVDGRLGPPGIRTTHLHERIGGTADTVFRLRADCEAAGWIKTRRASYPGETRAFGVIIELTAEGKSMVEDSIILQKQARRFAFLSKLYDMTDGDPRKIGPIREVATAINATDSEAFQLATYLHREGLVSLVNQRLTITHAGVKEIEDARGGRVTETEHFTQVVINNVLNNSGTITGSSIQQAGHGAQQTVGVTPEVRAMLEQFLRDLRADLDRVPDSDEKGYVVADAKAIEAELALPKPRTATLKERLASISRDVASKSLVAVVSAGVLKALGAIVAALP